MTLRHEDRIISEPPLTPDLMGQHPLNSTVKNSKGHSVLGHGQNATKTG